MAIPAPVEPEPEPIGALPPQVDPDLPMRPPEPIERGERPEDDDTTNHDEDSRAVLSRNP
jgi:hypothetical protein